MILFLCVYLRHIIKQTKVMRKKNNRKNVPIDAHVPYGYIALGGVLDMLISPFSSNASLCFCIGLLVVVVSGVLVLWRCIEE